MPHVIVEHSANLSSRVEMRALLGALHAAALETGVFPIGGLRTRAVLREDYLIADQHPGNAFCHVVLRIGHGRDEDIRKRAASHVFDAQTEFLADDFLKSPLSISLELQEIDPVLNFKKNNLHDLVKERTKA